MRPFFSIVATVRDGAASVVGSAHSAVAAALRELGLISDSTGAAPMSREMQRHLGKISRGTAVALGSRVFDAVLGFAITLYISRVLGAGVLGLYALGLHLVLAMLLFVDLGLPVTLARFVAELRARDAAEQVPALVRWAGVRIALMCAFAGGLMVLSGPWISNAWLGEPELAEVVPWLVLLLLLQAPIALLGQTLRGYQAVAAWMLTVYGLRQLVRGAAVVALVALGGGLRALIGAELVSNLLALLVLAILVRRRLLHVPRKIPLEPAWARKTASFARVLFFHHIVTFLNFRADILMLGFFLSSEAVGIYSIALAVAGVLPMLLDALITIFGPITTDLHARGETGILRQVYVRATRACFAVTSPLAVVLLVFAPQVLGLFGDEFRSGAAALTVLVAGAFVHVLVGPAGILLQMTGHQRLIFQVSLTTAVLTLFLELLLIPRWGILGAASAVAALMVVGSILRLVFARRLLGMPIPVALDRYFVLPLVVELSASLGVRAAADALSWPPLVTLAVALAATGLAAGVVLWRLFVSTTDRI